MKRFFIYGILFTLFYMPTGWALCRAKIRCKDLNGNTIGTIHLKTYRHGFLYHKCSVIKSQRKYVNSVVFRQELCAQKFKACTQGKGCRGKLIFKHSWALGHH